jgi:hypothetical protein
MSIPTEIFRYAIIPIGYGLIVFPGLQIDRAKRVTN